MSWIESHQSLLTHRKTIRASALLNINKYLLIGHLHALWWWALDNAEDDGCLGDLLPEELAEAAGWPVRKAGGFMEALESVGFIDQADCGKRLHNWYRYAGKLNEKRAKDRERKAEGRANSEGTPTEVGEKSQAPTNLPTVPTDLTNPPTDQQQLRRVWTSRCGVLPSSFIEEFDRYVEKTPYEWFEQAIEITRTEADRPNWKFCRAVLDRALDSNVPPLSVKEKPAMPMTLAEIRARVPAGRRR